MLTPPIVHLIGHHVRVNIQRAEGHRPVVLINDDANTVMIETATGRPGHVAQQLIRLVAALMAVATELNQEEKQRDMQHQGHVEAGR